MAWKDHLPTPRQFGLAAVVILFAGALCALVWWVVGPSTAKSVYRGMTFMLVAILHLPLRRQFVVGLLIGAAAFVGYLVADSVPALIAAVVVACLVQAVLNGWSIGVGALLPPALVAYSNSPPVRSPAGMAAAALVGAAVAIVAALIARRPIEQTPVPGPAAMRHAIALTVGCVAIVLIDQAVGLPHGNWAILTFCLVFLPVPEQTYEKMRDRVTGTLIGAVVAGAIAAQAPQIVCLALAVPCALAAVAFSLKSNEYLGFVIFVTPTIILLYGASKRGLDVVGLAAERVGLTLFAGLLAAVLTALVLRPNRGPRGAV